MKKQRNAEKKEERSSVFKGRDDFLCETKMPLVGGLNYEKDSNGKIRLQIMLG